VGSVEKMTDDKTWDVIHDVDAGSGQWKLDSGFGPSTQQRARAFFRAAVSNPLMKNIRLKHEGQIIEQHD
jgi:hypothetical protein